MKDFIKKLLRETINASEAHRDEDALKTVIDGKRDLGFITLKVATIPEKTFWDEIKKHGLRTISLPLNPYNAFIYFRKGAELKALELSNIANKYGGYLSYEATRDETIRIGQLLGYKESDISDYINKKYPVNEQMIDGQNMNQGTKTLCNKMTINSYQEAVFHVKKALEGMDKTTKNRIMQKIHVPLENLRQEQNAINSEIKNDGMSGDSMPDEADTYWHQIQTTICEMGPDFE